MIIKKKIGFINGLVVTASCLSVVACFIFFFKFRVLKINYRLLISNMLMFLYRKFCRS